MSPVVIAAAAAEIGRQPPAKERVSHRLYHGIGGERGRAAVGGEPLASLAEAPRHGGQARGCSGHVHDSSTSSGTPRSASQRTARE